MLTTGIGESYLAETISDWEDKVRGLGLGLAYLPSPGLVKLRLSSYKGVVDTQLINDLFQELELRLFDYAFGYENETLSGNVGNLLREKQMTVSTVESCTGGGVGNAIVNTPGSSTYFLGGLITYSYELKSMLANVSPKTLLTYGAVSEQTVIEMAKGGRSKIGSDYCISISGVAGPDGGTVEKPVGTVWMAIDCEEGCFTKKINLGDNRERNIQMTIFASLNMLRLLLLKKKE
jgi:nicotinamide-nucleotide amidase